MSEANTPNTPPPPEAVGRKRLPRSAAPSPDNPPLLEEIDLNDAEKKVLNAFREGWEAGKKQVIVFPDASRIPESFSAETWRTAIFHASLPILRASFLRSLFLGSYDSFASRWVTISYARIQGRLDLGNCESCFPLVFHRCIFSQGISLRAAIISELALVGCWIYHDKQGSSLSAQQVQVTTNVFLNDKFRAYGKVDLNGGDIGGQLACAGGRFENGLIAQSLKTGESVLLREGFKSNGEVNLGGANIGGQLACTGGHFEKGLTAQNLKAEEDVLLRVGFKSNREVTLNGANIGGHLDCHGGYFREGLIAVNLKAGEGVFLSEGFESNGDVNLLGANIGGQLICTGGHFKKGLIAQSLKVSESVILRKEFKSSGEVNLGGAKIGGQLDCTGTHFENGLLANGLRYQWIELGGNWEQGLIWLSKMHKPGNEFFSQPYEQLMTVYRRMGKPDWAREIGFELEKKRHKHLPKTWRFWVWRAWYSILQGTIGYGYKPFRSLWLAIGLPLVGTVLFSACTQNLSSKFTSSGCVPAFLANEWIPSEGEAHEYWMQKGQAPQGYPEFQPFIYSLEATFPVLPFGQLDKWHSDKFFFRWTRWGLTFFGSVLLAILALFGVGVLRPNWKSEDDSG